MRESLRTSIGSIVVIFCENGFHFEGKILDCDDDFLKIYDTRKNYEKFIKFDDIKEANVSNG